MASKNMGRARMMYSIQPVPETASRGGPGVRGKASFKPKAAGGGTRKLGQKMPRRKVNGSGMRMGGAKRMAGY